MKRYLLTSAKFAGQVEMIYDKEGVLRSLNMQETSLTAVQVHKFKAQVPALESELQRSFTADTTIVAAEFQVTFDMFWNEYDKKINRKRAWQIWEKMPKSKQVAAWAGIAGYDKYLKRESWRSKADPDTYLRNEMFENEYK